MSSPIERNIDRLYKHAVAAAKQAAGGEQAFDIIGPTYRRALVGEQVLILVDMQDSTTPDALVRRLLNALRERMVEDDSLER